MLLCDARGVGFDLAQPPQRIVSLVPSLTEALFAFGVGDRVVGVTDYCIHPSDGVANKRRLGGTKNPRINEIIGLAPDLVIANMEENRKPDVESLEASGIPVYATFPRTVRAAVRELQDLAALVGSDQRDAVIAPIEAALARVRPAIRRPRVFVAIWRDPWMTANGETCIGDLIETCGGDNIFRERARKFPLAADLGETAGRDVPGADTRYPRLSLDEIAAGRPDVVLLPDEPYRFTEQDARDLHETPGLENARIHVVDGTLITWAGVRMGRAIETLTRLLGSQ